MVQAEEGHVSGKVTKRVLGPDGKVAGKYDDNPYLNSIIYEVELADGRIKEYGANIIAENMLTQVDSDRFSLSLMEGIIDYKHDDSIAISKTASRGQRRLRKTTVGWKLLVKWRDQSESWIKLSELKESHPVETAEFAKSRGIDDEPAFARWVPHTLKKRNAIISAMKVKLRKTTHKYGIEMPTSVDHAMEIDRKNGNTMWKDALALEMYNVGVAFEILEEGQKAPPGWSKASGHLIWDVKMDFTRKARWVLDGHKTPDPIGSTFAGVVSRESVRIAFTYAALNDLQVFAADVWWVPHTLKKRNAIISAMKVRLRKMTHKYGIEMPTSVDHAMEIDRKNRNTMWKDALALEMYNVGVAFEILEEGQKAPPGWSKASGHLIWDVKMDFTRKARWVLDGHKTPDPIGSTFAGVVS